MQQNDAQYEKMIQTPIPRLVSSLAVPTMVSMLITSIYNVADTYFVSKLGTQASGAVGIVFSLMAVIQAIGFTVGMGAGSTISRLLGKKEDEKAQQTANAALLSSIILGVGLGVLGILFLEKLMIWMGATETILPFAVDYARYILYLCGSVLNIALDPLFIFVFRWGMQGAAAATAISQCIGCAVLILFFWRKKTIIRFSFRYLSKELSIYKTFFGNGMPSLFRQGLASAASVTLNHAAAYYGDAAVAAMSIVGKIFMMVYCVLIGFGQGYQPVVGYNYGAGEYARVRAAYRFLMTAGTIGMSVIGAGLFCFANVLMRQFVSDDGEVIEIGTHALRMQSAVMPFLPLGIACNMTFQAVGKSVKAAFLASCRQGVFFLPLIFVLPRFLGITAIEASQPAADLATFLVCIPIMHGFMRRLCKTKTGD